MWHSWSHVSQSLSGSLNPQANHAAFAAGRQAIDERFSQILAGMRWLQAQPSPVLPERGQQVAHFGSSRLLYYPAHNPTNNPTHTILALPSVINRYHIFDLTPEHSFIRLMQARGVSVYVLDWGEPGVQERHFSVTDYVEQRAIPALEAIHAQQEVSSRRLPVHVLGHCVGGVMALALAALAADLVDALILAATPWDFSPIRTHALPEPLVHVLQQAIDMQQMIPAELILSLFHMMDPLRYQEKMIRFSKHPPTGSAYSKAMALEHWANHSAPLPPRVASTCLIDWGQRNQLLNEQWRIGGRVLSAGRILCPTTLLIPQQDAIVPPASTHPLQTQLRHCRVIQADAGHAGLFCSERMQQWWGGC